MLESTALGVADAPKTKGKTSTAGRRKGIAFYGYLSLGVAIIAGWLLSDQQLVDPSQGLGYWLGIAGGSLMLLLLFYPSGKKSTILRRLGLVKHWFRVHMIFGLVGPLLILYHCNFSAHAINSTVAFYSMLAVAISGIIGRYFYTRIHRGLYGRRANIEELRAEITDATQNSRGLAAILPKFIGELHAVSTKLMGEEYTGKISMSHCLFWTCNYYVVRLRLYLLVRRELQEQAASSTAVQDNAKNLARTANNYAAQQVGLMRQAAQFALFERLFSLWHLFHMPLFLLLVVSALVHVLAVHMF